MTRPKKKKPLLREAAEAKLAEVEKERDLLGKLLDSANSITADLNRIGLVTEGALIEMAEALGVEVGNPIADGMEPVTKRVVAAVTALLAERKRVDEMLVRWDEEEHFSRRHLDEDYKKRWPAEYDGILEIIAAEKRLKGGG